MSRLRGRAPLLSVIAVVVGVTGLVRFLFTQQDYTLSRLNSVAGVTSLVIGIISLVVAVAGVAVAKRSGRPAGAPGEARDRLRRAVRRQWDREIGIRKLRTPRPLRLTWAPSPRGNVSARVVGARAPSGGLALRAGARPTVELMREFRDLPSRRLVVLGQAGAGKSVLAMLLTVDLLTDPEDGDPVPILLPIAGWDPAEEFGTWLARRVHEEYPDVVSASGAAELVAANQVMAVLDGLDEMPKALMPSALAAIDAASEGLWVVLTCRGAEYEKLTTEHAPLSRAAVVEIKSIDPDDAGVYLRDNEAEGDPRWLPVVSRMHADGGRDLAEALSTPLMLSLARDAYRASTSTPADLLAIADQSADAVKRRVLAEFLPAVYARTEAGRRPYPAAKADRWLRTLASRLADPRTDGVNLNWWQLDRAVPARLVGLFIAVVLMVVAVPAVFSLVLITGGSVEGAIGSALAGALLAAALAGPGTGRAVLGVPTRWVGLTVVTAALRDGLLGTLVFFSVIVFGGPLRPSWDLDYLAELSQPALVIMLICTAMGVITNGLAMTRSATPTRPSLSRRDLARGVLSGMGTAALLGLPVAATVGAIIGIIEDSWPEGLRYGGVIAAATIGVLGLVVGVARALASPVGDDQARSPRSVVFGDAITLALVTTTTAVAGGVAMWLVADLGGEPDASAIGIWSGVLLAVVVAAGSGAPWVRFRVAQALLALRGRLPWRLIRFLEDAHSREVLRQSGGSYQFRHDLVQAHLATVRPWSRPPRGGGPTRRAIHTTIAILVLAAVTATITVPSLRKAVETRTRQRAVEDLQARVERETDVRIKVRLALALDTAVNTTDADLIGLEAVRGAPTLEAPPDTRMEVDGTVITAVHDRMIWRLDSGTLSVATLPTRPHTFSVGGDRVITIDTGSATVWQWRSGDLQPKFTADWTNASVAPDGRHAIVMDRGSRLTTVDLATQVATPLDMETSTAPNVEFIDNGHALVGDSAVTILYSAASEIGRGDTREVRASAPNGHTLVRLRDGHTEFWDTTTGTRRDLGQPIAADLSADGRWALLGFDNRSQLVDLSGAVPTRDLPSSAHLTDDLQHVVSTTTDATEIRSLATNDLIATLPRTVQTAMTVAPGTGILAVKAGGGIQLNPLGPDSRPRVLLSDTSWRHIPLVVGDSIVFRSNEHGLFAWDLSALRDLPYDPNRGLACQVAERGFTESEWEEHVPGLPYIPTCPPMR